MGKIIYFWNPLIRAVRVVALFCRNWVPLAGGEGWKVYLAVDLGSLPFGDCFVFVESSLAAGEPLRTTQSLH